MLAWIKQATVIRRQAEAWVAFVDGAEQLAYIFAATAVKPFSYSSIEKTFYSFFINQEMLESPWDWKMDVGENPREIEKSQIIQLMNVIAETLYEDKFDPERGTDKIESKLQKGEDIPDVHLRAFRMAKEEILYSWLRFARDVIRNYFITQGSVVDDKRLFQYRFPEPLWNNIRHFVRNLGKLPMWIDHDMSITVFGGKSSPSVWQSIFEKGTSPQGQRVLSEPLNLIKLIQS